MRPMSPVRPSTCAIAVLIAAGAMAAAGCSDLVRASRLQPEGVNVESPAAGAVLAAEATKPAFPTFRDVPAKAVARPNARYATAVAQLTAERADFRAWEAANPAPASDVDAYAIAARKGVVTTSSTDQTQNTLDFAKRARAGVTPPPPVRP